MYFAIVLANGRTRGIGHCTDTPFFLFFHVERSHIKASKMKNDIGIFILILSLMFMMNTCAGMKGIENSIDRLNESVESGNSAIQQRDILSDAIRYKLDNDTVPMESVLKDMDIDIDDLRNWVYAY